MPSCAGGPPGVLARGAGWDRKLPGFEALLRSLERLEVTIRERRCRSGSNGRAAYAAPAEPDRDKRLSRANSPGPDPSVMPLPAPLPLCMEPALSVALLAFS